MSTNSTKPNVTFQLEMATQNYPEGSRFQPVLGWLLVINSEGITIGEQIEEGVSRETIETLSLSTCRSWKFKLEYAGLEEYCAEVTSWLRTRNLTERVYMRTRGKVLANDINQVCPGFLRYAHLFGWEYRYHSLPALSKVITQGIDIWYRRHAKGIISRNQEEETEVDESDVEAILPILKRWGFKRAEAVFEISHMTRGYFSPEQVASLIPHSRILRSDRKPLASAICRGVVLSTAKGKPTQSEMEFSKLWDKRIHSEGDWENTTLTHQRKSGYNLSPSSALAVARMVRKTKGVMYAVNRYYSLRRSPFDPKVTIVDNPHFWGRWLDVQPSGYGSNGLGSMNWCLVSEHPLVRAFMMKNYDKFFTNATVRDPQGRKVNLKPLVDEINADMVPESLGLRQFVANCYRKREEEFRKRQEELKSRYGFNIEDILGLEEFTKHTPICGWTLEHLGEGMDILHEGHNMSHCVGSYTCMVQDGRVALYHATHENGGQATVMLNLEGTYSYQVSQCYGYRNEETVNTKELWVELDKLQQEPTEERVQDTLLEP